MRNILIPFSLLACIISTEAMGETRVGSGSYEWSHSAGTSDAHRYSKADQISEANIAELELAFSYSLERNNDYVIQASPTKNGDHLITVIDDSTVLSINPGTGRVQWKLQLDAPVARRGMALAENMAFFPTPRGIYAVSTETGAIKHIYPGALSLVAPVIANKILYSISIDGEIRGYDINSGKQTLAMKLETPCGTARVWSGASYSERLGKIFLVTGNSDALAQNDERNCLANAIVAVDTKRQKIDWVFQELSADFWDLDMVSYPIIVDDYRKNDGNILTVVFALSKSGNLFMLDGRNGSPVAKVTTNKINGLTVKKSVMNVKSLDIGPLNNQPLSTLDAAYLSDMRGFGGTLFKYTRPTTGVPAIHGGIHGGFEWPGGGFDPKNGYLIAPSNFYPWVTINQITYQVDEKLKNLIKTSSTINRSCTSCHGEKLEGRRSSEVHHSNAGRYIPNLLVKGLVQRDEIATFDGFKKKHKYAAYEMAILANDVTARNERSLTKRVLTKLDEIVGLKIFRSHEIDTSPNLEVNNQIWKKKLLEIDSDTFHTALRELRNIHDYMQREGTGVSVENFWQPLTDLSGLPITRAPWGYLNAFDTRTGKLAWSVPFGWEIHKAIKYVGSRNFGGILVTASNLVFATGTVDKSLHIHSSKSGALLKSLPIGAVGSSPPITYTYRGCQFVVVVASGGRFWYNKRKGDKASVRAYKLKSCTVGKDGGRGN